MSLVFVCALSEGRVSGPTHSVTSLAKKLKAQVYTNVQGCKSGMLINGVSVKSRLDFFNEVSRDDLVVFAGYFDTGNLKLALKCLIKRIPYVLSSRGNLTKATFKRSSVSKWIYTALFGYWFAKFARAIHYLSDEERQHSYEFNHNYFIAKNGVALEYKINSESLSDKKNIILFVGRIDIYHKGLDILIDLVTRHSNALRDKSWFVHLYGPSNRNDKYILDKRISDNDIVDIVFLENKISQNVRNKKMAEAKIFVHLSRLEGQPQAVLEALSFGCVPFVSQFCNLSSFIIDNKSGIVCNIKSTESLDKFSELIEGDLTSMMKNSSSSITEGFDWETAALEFSNEIKRL